MLSKLLVIWTQKHGRALRYVFSRVFVAAMQCDWGASGSTTKSATKFGKCFTNSTKKLTKSFSFQLYVSINPLKEFDVIIRPSRTREGQVTSRRIILSKLL